MKLNELLKLRQVGGEYMIINPYSEAADMTQVISLNETAAWLWQQAEVVRSIRGRPSYS